MKRACDLAHAFESKLVRGFSFYHPKGSDPWDHIPQAADQLGQIADACHRSDLTLGIEVEANLVGQSGELMAELHRQVNHPALAFYEVNGWTRSRSYPDEHTGFPMIEMTKTLTS